MFNAMDALNIARKSAGGGSARADARAGIIVESIVEPAIRKAAADGKTSVASSLSGEDALFAEAVYAKLAKAGYDVSVAVSGDKGGAAERAWFTVRWSGARNGVPGKVIYPTIAA